MTLVESSRGTRGSSARLWWMALACVAVAAAGCGDDAASTDDGTGGGGTGGSGAGAGSSSTSTAAGDPDCPQAASFLDVSGDSAGADYPAPTLAVSCEGDEVVVASNGIPNFDFDQVTPNALEEQDFEFRFPRDPTAAAATTAVPLGGTVAVAVNGLPIFGPTEAGQDGYRDPLLDALLDYCNGHTAPGGVYHFHARPDCLFTDLEGQTSLVIGYAFDGYPILAPYGCDDADCTAVRPMKSSWQPIADQFDENGDPIYDGTTEGSWDINEYVEGSGDLDECNGRALSGGGYAYYATDTFPYFVGCYTGTPTANMMEMGPGGGHGGP